MQQRANSIYYTQESWSVGLCVLPALQDKNHDSASSRVTVIYFFERVAAAAFVVVPLARDSIRPPPRVCSDPQRAHVYEA